MQSDISFNRVRTHEQLALGVTILNSAFGTVAKQFGLTRENSPTNPAFMNAAELQAIIDRGVECYLAATGNVQNGFVAVEQSSKSETVYYIEKLAVLAEFRHEGLGRTLMSFAENRIKELGGEQISLGIVDENTVLKNWYISLGYNFESSKFFPHLPFRVGFLSKNLL